MATIPSIYQDYADNTHHFKFGLAHYDNERALYNKLLAESYNHFGVAVSYYVHTWDTTQDEIFGEDMDRSITRKFDLQAYFVLPKEIENFTKYAIEGIDLFHVYVSKEHFKAKSTTGYTKKRVPTEELPYDSPLGDLTYDMYDEYVPRAGDILKAKYNNYLYEIITVKDEEEMFLQQKHSWDFIVRPYRDGHSTISPILSGDSSADFLAQSTDMFDISGAIDREKADVLYVPSNTEEASGDKFGGW